MEVRKCYNLMKQQKLKCKLSGAIIEYNHRSYEHKDLHKLPEGCRLEDTQLVTCEDTNKNTSLCFQGSHAYVSNFYQTEIEYRDHMFTSAEQAFQWAKATQCNDLCIADKILEVDDPYVIKKLSEEITTNHKWALEEEQVLHEIVKQKFKQNQALYDRFVNSNHTAYYECTVGNVWGCGSKLNAIDLDPEILKGKNRFGLILTALKEEFQTNAPQSEETQPDNGKPT